MVRVSTNEDEGAAYKPGKLVLILGLILFEEISFVGLNCSMFVRGTPSVAAHTLISSFESDWLRKLTIAGLALAGVQTDGSDLQRYGTLTFIAFAVLVLGANLGARAWHFMKWKPMAKEGFFAPFISFLLAALTGFTLPYIGFGKIQAGGKAAVQLVIYNSIIVASMFVISDLDIIQQYLVDGSETCNQDITNIGLGVWFTLTVITCIFAALKIEPPIPHPEDDDHILVEDQTSPVGFKVPNFPDYLIDPSMLERNGFSRCSMSGEVMSGMVVGVLVGVAVACTGLFDLMNNGNGFVDESTGGNV